MNDKPTEELLVRIREEYNAPPPTPGDEMWDAIQSRLGNQAADEEKIVPLEAAGRRRFMNTRNPLSWAVAAAAVLVVGVGIGRMTAPVPIAEMASVIETNPAVLRVAAVEHLINTESLLTLVRADARAGRVEQAVGSWARDLLSHTRLLMDAQGEGDQVMMDLLEDLELVLIQIVVVANTPDGDQARIQSELNLALEGLETREVLPRIQAVIPAGPGHYGT